MKKHNVLWIIAILSVLFLCQSAALAQGETLVLPSDTKAIESEAFMNTSSLDTVVLPEGILTIGENAFAGSSLARINLPESLSDIAPNAFDGCTSIQAEVTYGSYAYQYCTDHQIPITRSTLTLAQKIDRLTLYDYTAEFNDSTLLFTFLTADNAKITQLNYDKALFDYGGMQVYCSDEGNGEYKVWLLSGESFSGKTMLGLGMKEDCQLSVNVQTTSGSLTVSIPVHVASAVYPQAKAPEWSDDAVQYAVGDTVTLQKPAGDVSCRLIINSNDMDTTSYLTVSETASAYQITFLKPETYYFEMYYTVKDSNAHGNLAKDYQCVSTEAFAAEPEFIMMDNKDENVLLFNDTTVSLYESFYINLPWDAAVLKYGVPTVTYTLSQEGLVKEVQNKATNAGYYRLMIGPAVGNGQCDLTVTCTLGPAVWQKTYHIKACGDRTFAQADVSVTYPETAHTGDMVQFALQGSDAAYFSNDIGVYSSAFSMQGGMTNCLYTVVGEAGQYRLEWNIYPLTGDYYDADGENLSLSKEVLYTITDAKGSAPSAIFQWMEENALLSYSLEAEQEGNIILSGSAVFPSASDAPECTLRITSLSPDFTVSYEETYEGSAIDGNAVFTFDYINLFLSPKEGAQLAQGLHNIPFHITTACEGKTLTYDLTVPVYAVKEKDALAALLPDLPETMAVGEAHDLSALQDADLYFTHSNYHLLSSSVTAGQPGKITAISAGTVDWAFCKNYINGSLEIKSGSLRITSEDDTLPYAMYYDSTTKCAYLYETADQLSIGHVEATYNNAAFRDIKAVCADGTQFVLTNDHSYSNGEQEVVTYTLSAVAPLVPGKHQIVFQSANGTPLQYATLVVLAGSPDTTKQMELVKGLVTLPDTLTVGDEYPTESKVFAQAKNYISSSFSFGAMDTSYHNDTVTEYDADAEYFLTVNLYGCTVELYKKVIPIIK